MLFSNARLLYTTLVFAILPVVLISELQAYQPGKWSPMDVYITEGKKGGPKRLVLKDSAGKILEFSDFIYDEDGHLLEEKFYDPSGKYRGKIEYTYALGKIAQEILKDVDGKLISTKEFNFHNKTMDIVVLDPNGTTIMRHHIIHDNMKVKGGKEINGKIKDQFSVSYDKQGRVSLFRFTREDGTSLSEIYYTYDEMGRLVSRKLKDDSGESICKYEYDASGKLISYTYFNGSEGNWVKDKYLEFFFNGKSENERVLSAIN